MSGVDLATPGLDVGLFTNRLAELGAFYGQDLGLPFERLLPIPALEPIGPPVEQHRYRLGDSVLKINHAPDPLPDPPTGYRRLVLARPGVPEPRLLHDPDGLEVELVPPGHRGVEQVGVVCAVASLDAAVEFLVKTLGADLTGGGLSLGGTVLFPTETPGQPRSGAIRARGVRYLTLVVRDVVAEHRRLADLGVDIVTPPTRVGDVAMVSFIRDPGGNWLELAQRGLAKQPPPG